MKDKTIKIAKMGIARWLPWAAVVLWMGVIFAFSAQTGESSGSLSGSLTEKVASLLTPHWSTLSDVQREACLKLWHTVIRKGAHVTEFAVLGGLLMNAIARTKRCAGWRQAGLAALGGLFYAASDEIHQMFVPARGPAVTDVLIDFSGVAIGVLLAWLILKMQLQFQKSSKRTL